MINFDSMVISLPAHELSDASFGESVFAASSLKKMTLPSDLRTAVEVVLNNCEATGTPVRCIARPEIFTHGASLEWLRKEIGPATDHLNLSDGTVLKAVPGMRNHVFVYGLQSAERLKRFNTLTRRAPELLPQFQTQVNSFHRSALPGKPIAPMPEMVTLRAPFAAQILWFYAFYLNPHSVEDSVNHMLSWGEFEEKRLAQFERVTYVPLTEVGMLDHQFQAMLCQSIAMTYFDQNHCLLFRLPSTGADLASRIAQALECVRSAGLQLPRARAHNIFFLADDLPEQSLQRLGARVSFVLHQSVEFWRYTRRLYETAGKITVYASADPGASFSAEASCLAEVFGRPPEIVLRQHASHESGMPELMQ